MLNLALSFNLMFEGLIKGICKSNGKSPYLCFKIKMLLKMPHLTDICFLFQIFIISHYEKF